MIATPNYDIIRIDFPPTLKKPHWTKSAGFVLIPSHQAFQIVALYSCGEMDHPTDQSDQPLKVWHHLSISKRNPKGQFKRIGESEIRNVIQTLERIEGVQWPTAIDRTEGRFAFTGNHPARRGVHLYAPVT